MTKQQLADKLVEMQTSGLDDKTTMSVLFGFLFSAEITDHGGRWRGLTDCPTAVDDGRRLARHIRPPEHLIRRWKAARG